MDALLDCYAGAYGLTIRYDAASSDDLRELRETLRVLSTGEAREVAVHQIDGLRVTNLNALTLVVLDDARRVAIREVDRGTFVWANTTDGWQRCLDLVDRLIDLDEPGHQYLTDGDEALVEVCLRERRPPTSE